MSNIFIFVGAFAFSYALFQYFNATPKAATQHKLKQSNSSDPMSMFTGADGTLDITSMANLASMAIWGMVLAKARSGLEAVETQDTTKVGGLLSKVTSLIVLITVSAICKMVALSTTLEPVSVPPVEVAHNTPLLKQSRQEKQYPESYYDESSSHYLGGAHNVALQSLRTANTSKAYTR